MTTSTLPLEIDSDVERVRRFTSRLRLCFAVADALAALLVVLGVFVGLPTRWAAIDVPAAILALLLLLSSFALARRPAWMDRVVRVAAFVQLGIGLFLVAITSWTAAYLNGIYGPVGRGGALILVLVAAIVLPYLVLLPASKLLWIGPRAARRAGGVRVETAETVETPKTDP